jgi:competence protein ComEC
MKRSSRFLVLALIVCLLGAFYLLDPLSLFSDSMPSAPLYEGEEISDPLPELSVRVVNVGHGDFILVQNQGKTMVIDTGEDTARKAVTSTLSELNIQRIDVMILTHPHSDHIGNASYLLDHLEVGTVYMTGREHTTKLYRTLVETLEEHTEVAVKEIKAGERFSFGESECLFLGPLALDYDDINDTSAVMILFYGNMRLLFTGDAEERAERDYISYYGDELQADFLKIGHHANNSTTQAFAERVRPAYAAASIKPLEEYGDKERAKKNAIFQRLEEQYATKVYRTDRDGDILIRTDGLELTVTTEK